MLSFERDEVVGLIKALGGSADPAVIEAAVDAWLDDHPEATTTVEDGSITEAKLDSNLKAEIHRSRVTSLDATSIASGAIVEAVGIPAYVDDVVQYAAYGLTETGWYLFVRIAAKGNVVVSAQTTVTGAAGYIATVGAAYVDVAVRFGTTAESQAVAVAWSAGNVDAFVFRATDLAVRNLDYRVTFYVYDIAPYARWEYALTADAAFAADKAYFTEVDGVYSRAEVETVAYVLTADTTFAAGKTYYTWDGEAYSAAEVTAGEAVAEGTYYEATTVPVPAYYEDGYVLTADATFQDGTTYYTRDGETYSPAEVTVGEAVTPDTYYVAAKVRATGVFAEGATYYTLSGAEYTAAEVTAGERIPAYYNHSKLHFEGMSRNVTYRLEETVDCPIEIVLPEVADDGHGAWFEIQMRYNGSYSCTLLPPTGVKIGTATTQAQSAGVNTIDLQYTDAGDVKMWTLLNTHSNIPT